MKYFKKYLFSILIFFFFFGNIYFIITGVSVSKQIHEYEVNEEKYQEENTILETEVSKISSLQYASSMSASLTIDKEINPIYLNNAPFALNR
ncbi:hypothetical protein COY87_03445 [Candidatus Roizmanbacteria bacterium CG_4_10_14_0_8_um_filter_33_9]|uniref:Cell division protein FtsL n=1 Tax=Candidatus Roizmanbacteria bacterium CG_4_10_14_0_8_um_filter_33_9 TaxID=1974826 RepID=A0A2M7QI17_9BACT|nr:MAG: hypothetical protein COY87_03445 [Candidatus Roizmanbacteria bacterium CG_4_10_14_0_8_um_filter_33_9]